ncbi:MAG: phosphate ABC transporter permease [Candidatus Rokuibacteriota bacterium]|nr:MAG: phosphate ABC transporter permease [Candidatus Rokubacteria bacterium]
MVDRVAEAAGPAHVVIRPSTGWTGVSLRDLWAYRELLYFLAWRDIKVRYKQTALGVIWVVIQPLFAMLVFSVFFGRLAGMPSDGVPYPVFAFCALLPWQLFAHALTESSASLVTNQNLITKVYFPRLIIPLAPVLASLLDFLIAFGLLLGMLAYYRITPTLWVWTLPLFLLLAIALAIGVGLWLAALNARYRDVRYTIPFLTQIWLFATPIAYPSSLVPEPWRAWYGLNPMAGVVDGFRWALLGTADAPGGLMAVSAAVTLVILVSGVHYFRRTERTFADTI